MERDDARQAYGDQADIHHPAIESDLIDVTGIDLDGLAALPRSALMVALRRIADEDPLALDWYAGFERDIN
ncbi:hypothetical protein O7626_04280 [Micromonospora sp. WMMD1102]|uniref:hypothetical protein n=1 Tax=Micromonospora sp. WMMD1102 TaxID=3016105 RepID=UPI0024157317|nr:hypothetical protein [Micromonospora sp. WMMD1102]MDG4785157.1 hypothetical protein [Micromonospora sp. WMMD1102]